MNLKKLILDLMPPMLARGIRRVRGLRPPVVHEGTPVYLYFHKILGSSSQFGEDLIVDLLLARKVATRGKGSYVDVGANDPVLLNNTNRLYELGWNGINIEPTIALYEKFLIERPDDINLCIGCGDTNHTATFYEMSFSELSTFNADNAAKKYEGKKQIGKRDVEIRTLKTIFDAHLKDREIDVMSVDVEGDCLRVLRGNDWTSYRPLLLLLEVTDEERTETLPYLQQIDYVRLFDNTLNLIAIDRARLSEVSHTIERMKT